MKSASLQYANALADIALEQGAGAPLLAQFGEFNAACEQSLELRTFLGSPAVNREAKHAVILALLARLGGSKIMGNFLFLVVDHQRTSLLPQMLESFQQVLQQRQGQAEAEVVSASPMNDEQKSQLQQSLLKLTGKKIQANYSLDPALLGGLVVRIGDTIYDGSLKNRLNQMRSRLTAE